MKKVLYISMNGWMSGCKERKNYYMFGEICLWSLDSFFRSLMRILLFHFLLPLVDVVLFSLCRYYCLHVALWSNSTQSRDFRPTVTCRPCATSSRNQVVLFSLIAFSTYYHMLSTRLSERYSV